MSGTSIENYDIIKGKILKIYKRQTGRKYICMYNEELSSAHVLLSYNPDTVQYYI